MFRPIAAVVLGSAFLAACAASVTTDDISYIGRGKSAEGTLGIVTVESRYGGGQTVSGPVRRNEKDRLEVRLPGGTWIECVQSCRETLRRQTVDFWQNYGGSGNINGGTDSPGTLNRFLNR